MLYRLASSSSPQTNVVVSAADDQYKNKCGSPPRKSKCRIAIGNAAQKEGNSGSTLMTFTVTLDSKSDETVTVDFTTAPIGSAVQGGACGPGIDYVVSSGTLVFVPGDTSEPINVTICGDTLKEPNETFNVNLSNPSPNAFIGNATGVGTITNDDKP